MQAVSTRSDEELSAKLAADERKELLRFVVIGSVDDGKSTLIGRLLFEAQGLYEDQISAVRRASKPSEDQPIDYSLFTDGLRAEREQGITIDVAYRYFSTPRRKFIIADTPGHTQYTRNMATGASTADAAIILIDARHGVLAQTRRHAYLASLLGIPRLAVAINKMDLVGFSEPVFQQTVEALATFVRPLGFDQVTFFPVSATAGDNVAHRGDRSPWYTGQTILEFLETVPIGRAREPGALRFPVQLVLRPHLDYRGFAGQLASGTVRVGDELLALPSRTRARVRSIDTFEGPLQEASSPQSVSLQLEDNIDLSRGDMLVHPGAPAQIANQLEATLVWMGSRPLEMGRDYLLKHTTRRVKARVSRVVGKLDLETLVHAEASALAMNDIARVTVDCRQPLFVDPYAVNRATGAFILVDLSTQDTVAAGMIDGARLVLSEGAQREVTAEERRLRFGHGGAVICVAPASRDLAIALERTLFDRGCSVIACSDEATARACALAGFIAVLTSARPSQDQDPSWISATDHDGTIAALASSFVFDPL